MSDSISVLNCRGRQVSVKHHPCLNDRALKEAQEQSEDNIDNGVRDLLNMLGLEEWSGASRPTAVKYRRVLYFGITCGLSAPYVASQLDVILRLHQYGLDYYCALVGCNPISLARSTPIPNWKYSFRDIASQIAPPHHVINPVVGPGHSLLCLQSDWN